MNREQKHGSGAMMGDACLTEKIMQWNDVKEEAWDRRPHTSRRRSGDEGWSLTLLNVAAATKATSISSEKMNSNKKTFFIHFIPFLFTK